MMEQNALRAGDPRSEALGCDAYDVRARRDHVFVA